MTKHVLCAVDLTHEGEAKALMAEAAKLAKMDGAAISLATVLPDYGSSWVGSFFKDGTLKEASTAALKTLHEIADSVLGEGAQVQCIVEVGSAYEKILEAAELAKADLIVVGASKPDLADHVMGPNAARVARHAKVSVLVVRQ